MKKKSINIVADKYNGNIYGEIYGKNGLQVKIILQQDGELTVQEKESFNNGILYHKTLAKMFSLQNQRKR